MIMSASTHPYPVSNQPFTLSSATRSATSPTSLDSTDRFELKNAVQAASAATMMGRAERVLVQQLRGQDIDLDTLSTYGTVTHGNNVTQGLDRAYFTQMMLPAIREAKDSVHIAMLSMDGGRFPNYVADVLIAKKKANPDFKVRIIADDVGSAMPFGIGKGSSMVERLRDAGIEVELNLMARDGLEHRKVVIVDGKTAFFGGACLSDPYFASDELFKALDALPASQRSRAYEALWKGEDISTFVRLPASKVETPDWQDYGVQVTGPAVHQLQANFFQTWAFQGGHLSEVEMKDFRTRYFPSAKAVGDVSMNLSFAMPGGPSELRRSLLSTLNAATKTIDVEMAYIFEDEFIEALESAAKRGVNVRLVTNSLEGIDLFFSWHLNRQGYERLLGAGVELYETKQYTHRKQVVVDDRFVYLSTGNPEFNSWERGFDINAILDSKTLADVVTRSIETGVEPERAALVSMDSLREESLWIRFQTWLYGILASLFMKSADHHQESLGLLGPKVKPVVSP